jgi:hypothetical protein
LRFFSRRLRRLLFRGLSHHAVEKSYPNVACPGSSNAEE